MKNLISTDTLVIKMALVLAIIHNCTANSSCRILRFKPALNGKRLANHVVHRKKVGSEEFCQALCYMENNCVSINFRQTGDKLCELNDARKEEFPEDLIAAPESKYYEAESPCPKNPCPDRATCQVGLNDAAYRCVCPTGYTGQSCDQDIDECRPASPCHVNATCLNTLGSYVCECDAGFTGDGKNCDDINECDEPNACDANANCTNIPGSFSCNCSTGFQGNGSHCDDIDECAEHSPCLAQATSMTCSLAPNNSYACHCALTDTSGIVHHPLMPCTAGSACSNSPGSYECCCSMKGSPHCTADLWFPTGDAKDYVTCPGCIQSSLTAFTICFWIRSVDKSKQGNTFSYYTNRDEILIYNYNALSITVGNGHGSNTFSVTDGNWHHICFTWENVQGRWEIYEDGALEATAAPLRKGYIIPGGGKVVLGQEQDSPEGGFDSWQAFIGVMSGVNVWDHVKRVDDISAMSTACTADEGNVINWSSFLSGVRGNVRIIGNSTCNP